ncbi:MAG: hypothetical protein H6819_07205 [Phycisphaerales bacterium]|nr:hypothetical protein [Phycisphaerales bacterium]MCB9857718.1 hypothetical protein [Phycisphaerales bacterium]
MAVDFTFHKIVLVLLIGAAHVMLFGCEGSTRRHDKRVVDITPPEDNYEPDRPRSELPVVADEVEDMMAARQAYIDRLIELERVYLESGNTEKANWARRQRELTEKVEVYPYLSEDPPEKSSQVAPIESIPEADRLYEEAYALYDTFVGVPFIGFTKLNTKDARTAEEKFRTILREYPTSDKVDDAAYYCGVIYKEFLREDDPDNQLALRYFKWALELDPKTPHAARFDMAVVYDYRLHDRARAIELYHEVLETEEAGIQSNQRWAAHRIEKLTDDDRSPLRPRDRALATSSPRTRVRQSYSSADDDPTSVEPGAAREPR